MSVRAIEAEVSIKSGVSADVTIGREVIRTVYVDPVLESLSVTENGVYEPAEGVDGYSDVNVSVPERIPATESLSVTENGTYEPTEGIDGYDRVVVDVPSIIPDIEPLTVTENGVYTAEGDGFNPVTVNVPIGIKASGNFTPVSPGITKTINTGRTDWTHMLIVPHVFPYVGLTSSGLVRAIMSKHVDLENNVMITAYASSSGASYTSSSWKNSRRNLCWPCRFVLRQ